MTQHYDPRPDWDLRDIPVTPNQPAYKIQLDIAYTAPARSMSKETYLDLDTAIACLRVYLSDPEISGAQLSVDK